jgi:hypothetical protein
MSTPMSMLRAFTQKLASPILIRHVNSLAMRRISGSTQPFTAHGFFLYIQKADPLTCGYSRSARKSGNYICPECGKSLSRIDSLTRHRRSRHHVGWQYFCRRPGCERRTWGFGRFDIYRRHMKTAHRVVVEAHDAQERSTAGRRPPAKEKAPGSAPARVAAQPERPEKRSSYICIPLPSKSVAQKRSKFKPSRHLPTPSSLDVENEPMVPSSAALGPLRLVDDIEALARDELVLRLRAKMLECEELKQRNRILAMERDEYLEALSISEELRRSS